MNPFRTPEPPTMPRSRFYVTPDFKPGDFFAEAWVVIMAVIFVVEIIGFWGWGLCTFVQRGWIIATLWLALGALLFVRRGVPPKE